MDQTMIKMLTYVGAKKEQLANTRISGDGAKGPHVSVLSREPKKTC
jgi:hypothetical protein